MEVRPQGTAVTTEGKCEVRREDGDLRRLKKSGASAESGVRAVREDALTRVCWERSDVPFVSPSVRLEERPVCARVSGV